MTDDLRSYRAEPDAVFVDRLERDLLRRIGVVSDSSPPTFSGDETMTLEFVSEGSAHQLHRRSWRTAFVAAAAVAVVVVGALIVARPGRDGPPTAVSSNSLRDVAFELVWPDLRGLESTNCIVTDVTYASAPHDRCFRRFIGEVSLSGDVSGAALWTMLGNLGEAADAEDSAVVIPAAFTATYLVQATVAECGTGEFMIAEQLRFDGWESGAFSGTWQVVPGSGRGELAAISGGGDVPGDFPDEGTTQATRTGQLGCG